MKNLIDTLKQNGWQTASQLKVLGFSDLDIKQALQDGEIQKQGERRGTRYNVVGAEEFTKVTEFSDSLRHDVLNFIGTKGITNTTEIVNTLSCDKSELLLVLQDLVVNGEVMKSGAKKGTKYHMPNFELPSKEDVIDEPKIRGSNKSAAPRKQKKSKSSQLEESDSESTDSEPVELSL